MDGDFRSYTVHYLGPDVHVGGQTPYRLKLRDEKVGGSLSCVLSCNAARHAMRHAMRHVSSKVRVKALLLL